VLDHRKASLLRNRAAKILTTRPTTDVEQIARESIAAVMHRRVPAVIAASDLETLAVLDRVLAIVHNERAAMRETEVERRHRREREVERRRKTNESVIDLLRTVAGLTDR
jgi:hypothetical protein